MIDPFEDSEGAVTALPAAGLSRVSFLANELRNQEKNIADLEEVLKKAKQVARELAERQLPEAMLELGLSELKLADGSKVTIKDVVQASIPKGNILAALNYLSAPEIGAESLIKSEVSVAFSKGEKERAQQLTESLQAQGLNPLFEMSVHPQTLSAWVRERLANGAPVDLELLGVYTGKKAVIK